MNKLEEIFNKKATPKDGYTHDYMSLDQFKSAIREVVDEILVSDEEIEERYPDNIQNHINIHNYQQWAATDTRTAMSRKLEKLLTPMITQDEAKQLRIGNYLQRLDDSIFQVTAQDILSISKWEGNEGLLPMFIPLSEEILLRLGAEKIDHIHGYSFYSLSKSKINKCHIDIYETRTEWMSYRIEHCKYLHQLQNAFKVLTGQELELKIEQ